MKCPAKGVAVLRHLMRELELRRTPQHVPPSRFVCSSDIAESIGDELVAMDHPKPERRLQRGRPYLVSGDRLLGLKVEVDPMAPPGLAWIS